MSKGAVRLFHMRSPLYMPECAAAVFDGNVRLLPKAMILKCTTDNFCFRKEMSTVSDRTWA